MVKKAITLLIFVFYSSFVAAVPFDFSGPGVFSDPEGDFLNNNTHDIRAIGGTFNDSNIQFGVEFVDPIAPASDNLGNSLFGFIDIDVDQDLATGSRGHLSDPAITGIDFFIDLGSESTDVGSSTGRSVEVFLGDGTPTGTTAEIDFFSPNAISVTLSLANLSNDDGIVDFGVVVGTSSNPADFSDESPNNGDALTLATSEPETASVPEPSMVFTIALLGLLFYLRKWYSERQLNCV